MGYTPGHYLRSPLLLPLPRSCSRSNPRFELHTCMVLRSELTFSKYLKRDIMISPGGAQQTSTHQCVGRGTVIVHSSRLIHRPNPHRKNRGISNPLNPRTDDQKTHRFPTASGPSFDSALSPSIVPFPPPSPSFRRENNSFSLPLSMGFLSALSSAVSNV